MNYSNYNLEERQRDKMHSLDRVIELQPMEGKTPLSSTGAVDKRIFNGENNLHGLYNNDKGLWEFKYERGDLPGALQCQFTTFNELLNYARAYFQKRNVEIKGVIG